MQPGKNCAETKAERGALREHRHRAGSGPSASPTPARQGGPAWPHTPPRSVPGTQVPKGSARSAVGRLAITGHCRRVRQSETVQLCRRPKDSTHLETLSLTRDSCPELSFTHSAASTEQPRHGQAAQGCCCPPGEQLATAAAQTGRLPLGPVSSRLACTGSRLVKRSLHPTLSSGLHLQISSGEILSSGKSSACLQDNSDSCSQAKLT